MSWDAASRLAMSIATGGQPENNVDPVERIRLEQLARVAELHVSNVTGLTVAAHGTLTIVPVNRTTWAQRTLPAYRPLFEKLTGSLAPPTPPETDQPGTDPMSAMLNQMMTALGPMMLSMTAGSLVGHLASRALGQYDLPIPHPPGDEIMVVVPSIDEFASEWSLTPDDVRLWVCLHEVTTHAVLQVPHVRARLMELLDAWAGGFEPDSSALEERLGSLEINDISDLQKLQSSLGDPEILLGAIQSDDQRALLPRLEALVQTITGYTDHVMDQVGGSLIGGYGMLTEALRRRRVEASQADRFVERLLGLELTRGAYERGERFVDGIVERAGEDALAELWSNADNLPTPNELDAPGLWLARVGIEFEDSDLGDLGELTFDDAELGELGIDPGPPPDEDPPPGS